MTIRWPFLYALVLSLTLPDAALPAQDPALTQLRVADTRLATIAHRLTTANATLCDVVAPAPGFTVHAIDQYDSALDDKVRATFGFETAIAVQAVVPGGPAAMAGIVPGDSIATVNGVPVPQAGQGGRATSATRDAFFAMLASQPAAAPLRLELVRNGRRRVVSVPASPGCHSLFELLLGRQLTARADGTIVQIGVAFLDRYPDEAIAVIAAHELSHNILRHRVRLNEAGVSRGVFRQFGRNGRLFRGTEQEADLLGAHLLRNAGYDPRAAVRFWREHGGDIDGGIFRSRTHPSSSARADAIEREIAAIPVDAPIPYRPGELLRAAELDPARRQSGPL